MLSVETNCTWKVTHCSLVHAVFRSRPCSIKGYGIGQGQQRSVDKFVLGIVLAIYTPFAAQ